MRDWDTRQKEPSNWFYGLVTGLGIGVIMGMGLVLVFGI